MEIQFPQILFQIINFGVVVFVLTKFLYKPILKILEERAEKVEAGLKAAEANLKASQEISQTEEAVIAKARLEAKKIIADAKKTATQEADKILTLAKTDAKKVLEVERKNLLSVIDTERQAFEKQLVSIVSQTTAKVLGDGLSKKDQEAIINSQLKDLESLRLS